MRGGGGGGWRLHVWLCSGIRVSCESPKLKKKWIAVLPAHLKLRIDGEATSVTLQGGACSCIWVYSSPGVARIATACCVILNFLLSLLCFFLFHFIATWPETKNVSWGHRASFHWKRAPRLQKFENSCSRMSTLFCFVIFFSRSSPTFVVRNILLVNCYFLYWTEMMCMY